jgi:hypothetical protein
VSDLVTRIVQVHEALESSGVPHAFGGALALAWCTARARGTIDIDVNVFVPGDEFMRVIDALPKGVKVTKRDLAIFKRDGQVRIWWDKTPLDLFLNTTDYHTEVAERIRWEKFGGTTVPFLSCLDLAVFKAFFNRTKDWADLEEMQAAGTLDVERVRATLVKYMGADDERLSRLHELARTV